MALFGKKKGLVGLDIGSSAVKAVELKSGGKGGAEHQLVNIGMEALPPEAIVDGAIMDSGAVIDAIQRLFSSQKIKTSDVATSVSGNAVIVKKISLPQMSPEELAESIHWEAEQYIPFDIQDVALDYEVIEGSGGGGNMDVLLVAVKKDKISDYTSAISQAGKNPAMVDVDVFALQNCLRDQLRDRPRPRDRAAQRGRVDHEHQHHQGRHVDLQPRHRGGRQPVHRRHPEGPEPLLRPGGGAQARLARGGRGPREPRPDPPGGIREHRPRDPEDLRLLQGDDPRRTGSTASSSSGGTSKVHGLQELLADRFEAGVEIMNPFNNITYNPRDFDPEFINEIGPSAAIAVGLAVRKVGDR